MIIFLELSQLFINENKFQIFHPEISLLLNISAYPIYNMILVGYTLVSRSSDSSANNSFGVALGVFPVKIGKNPY